jgi:hypothetical protein
LKTGFFKQVMELKIQRKNPGSPLLSGIGYNSPVKEKLLPVQFKAGSLMFS